MSLTYKHLGAVALAVVVSTGLGACGSDSGSASSSASTRADIWKIGLQAPLTGDQSELGIGMLNGARLAAIQINANGGVLGKQIEIVKIDDRADPTTGITAATAAIAAGLNGVIGPYNSGVGAKTLPLYLAAGVVPMRLTSDNSTDGQGYTLQPMSDAIAPVTAQALTKFLQAESVGIIYDSSQNYTQSTSASVKKLLEGAGVTVTSYQAITPGKGDYKSVVKEIEAKQPSAIYSAVYFPEGAKIAAELTPVTQSSASKCVLDYASYDNGYITNAGTSVAKRCSVIGVPSPTDFKGSRTYVRAYIRELGEAPGAWSPYTYDSLNVLADAAAKVGSWDATKLGGYLSSVSGWKGWTGKVAIDPKTGNRDPATVVVTKVTKAGAFTVNQAWATAVGAPY